MAGRTVPISTDINLVLILDKSETGKYCRAVIYTSTDVVVNTVSLTEETTKGAGVYQGVWTSPANQGDYYAVYRVYTDSGHTVDDTAQPSNASETFFVASSVATGNAAYSHTDTLTNEDTSAPIDGANVYFYSDAGRTALLTTAVTDSSGIYTAYFDSTGTKYRRIIATGYDPIEDTITVI